MADDVVLAGAFGAFTSGALPSGVWLGVGAVGFAGGSWILVGHRPRAVARWRGWFVRVAVLTAVIGAGLFFRLVGGPAPSLAACAWLAVTRKATTSVSFVAPAVTSASSLLNVAGIFNSPLTGPGQPSQRVMDSAPRAISVPSAKKMKIRNHTLADKLPGRSDSVNVP